MLDCEIVGMTVVTRRGSMESQEKVRVGESCVTNPKTGEDDLFTARGSV